MFKDIFCENTELHSDNIQIFENKNLNKYTKDDIKRIYERILNSERPVIIAGGGINRSNAYDEVEKFDGSRSI